VKRPGLVWEPRRRPTTVELRPPHGPCSGNHISPHPPHPCAHGTKLYTASAGWGVIILVIYSVAAESGQRGSRSGVRSLFRSSRLLRSFCCGSRCSGFMVPRILICSWRTAEESARGGDGSAWRGAFRAATKTERWKTGPQTVYQAKARDGARVAVARAWAHSAA
jgi:hypothetical protein